MKYKLFTILLTLLLSVSLPSCRGEPARPAWGSGGTESGSESAPPGSSALLGETEDRGEAYVDSFIFLGESTTYHMINRAVLKGGVQTTQVWGPDNGTINLDTTTVTLRIRYPDTGEYLTIAEAAARKKPAYLVLTFGLNGAVQNVKRGAESYKACYRSLLDAIHAASPETKLILQSAFPVAENMDMSNYSVTVDGLNQRIETINSWTLELAEECGLRYLNTAEILKDDRGRLRLDYQSGDGHHLTRDAYLAILRYIRTHGYQ